MNALEGVKVVCVGQFYFAPYCTMLMARLGADVVKVEAPEGDPYRRLSTAGTDGTSVQFSLLNSGKRGIRLDLKSAEGQDILRGLAEGADVLVQNLSPGAMERFGLGYDALHELNPRLVVASGTGFGSFGPYAGQPAMDLTIQARTAIMSTTGFQEGPPLRTGPSVVDFMAGVHLFGGIMAALYQREHTGEGQHVEVSLQDAILPSLSSNIAGLINSGGVLPERTGNRHGGLAVVPYNAYPTTDGWVTVLCPTQGHWQRLCDVMGDAEASSERYATMGDRCDRVDEVDTLVGRWTAKHSKADVERLLNGTSIPTASVVSLPELMEDPHVEARGVLRWVNDDAGRWLTLGSPLFLSDSPTVAPGRAPGLGQDTDEILRDELGLDEAAIADLRGAGVI